MSTLTGGVSVSTHVDRTKDSTRSDVRQELSPLNSELIASYVCVWCLQVVCDVVVRDTHQLSPTERGFTLCVQNSSLSFKSGQW